MKIFLRPRWRYGKKIKVKRPRRLKKYAILVYDKMYLIKYNLLCEIFSIYVGTRIMAVQNQDETFENLQPNFSTFELVLSSDNTDLD